MSSSRDIIVYHYSYSPYARRIVWYLNLRNIPFSECVQPPIMPRPDVEALGVAYRRIPIVAIGRDIYNDTRLILSKLDELFPPSSAHPALSPTTPEHRALAALFSTSTTDGGLFADPKFTADRAAMSGRPWSAAFLERARPESLVEVRAAIAFLENGLLADGRKWLLNTPQVSSVDLEAIWPLHWVFGMPGAIPAEVASKETFPKVFAWVERFNAAVGAARKANGNAKALKGFEAAEKIWGSEWAEGLRGVDERDPVGLKAGQEVLVHPTDSGVTHKDQGTLVGWMGRRL
ncbi:hypothetical protein VC83_06338 [Pseudogymnoascus destructans]|uniref:Uncharacterized protein n=1 Tax=Pseudogymnoascus destructans TaxID=655981 RepID=A0A177ABP7_9PEZI|nr:uncharacterized protein VC83_06338 [Pseudogymnoascus destructans]OAF58852.1 hypothetical protein VC83_06338 [Pseudogymnoascus destructans]